MSEPPVSTISNLLLTDACDHCGRRRFLYARSGGVRFCSDCYKAAGRPRPDDLGLVHELEVRTRERMTARGSTDRHLVRNGRT